MLSIRSVAPSLGLHRKHIIWCVATASQFRPSANMPQHTRIYSHSYFSATLQTIEISVFDSSQGQATRIFLFPTAYGHALYTFFFAKSKLYYGRRSVGQSVLVSGRHLGPATNFFPSLFIDSHGFVDVGRPLWREVGSVVLRCRCASPAQTFSGLSPAALFVIKLYFIYLKKFSSYLTGSISPLQSPTG
jgi:hypothetical protein